MLTAMPNAPSYLLAYNPFPVSQRAMARAVLGEIQIKGKLPVSLPGLYPRGHGLAVQRIAQRGEEGRGDAATGRRGD